jgi:MSHA biogenesis protein MshQ
MDQPFSYTTSPVATVTAQAVAGTTTQNYTGNFWRLLTSSLNPTYTSSSSLTLNSASPTSSITFVDNANGTGTYTFGSGTGFILQRISALSLTAPVTLEMKLASTYTDQDGATFASNPFVFGGTAAGTGITFNGGKAFYYGQMTLSNASGSELSSLDVPFQTQYYNGTDFQVNTVDNCTSFSNASWVSLTSNPNTLVTTPTITPISSGIGAITLSTPSPAGTSGTVTVTTNLSATGANMPWLEFAWPNDASNTTGQLIDSPSAIATFGGVAIPGGTQQVIYENEVVH